MTLRAPYLTPPKTPITVSGQAPYNLALLAAVVVSSPFVNVDLSKANTVRRSAPDQFHTDISKFTNPIPFAQTDWSKPSPKWRLVYQAPFNQNLFALVQPFTQLQWPAMQSVRNAAPQIQPFNPNIFTNPIPFTKFDWSTSWRVSDFLPPASYSLNLNLIPSQAPFAQFDWSRSYPLRLTQVPILVGFQINQQPPIIQLLDSHDWVKRKRRKPRDFAAEELEIKFKRRQAIEDAIWPPTTYSLPELKLPDRAAALPDTDDLSRVIHTAQIEQNRAARIKAEAEDEEDLLNILKDIL